jgi:PDZ domain-containing protein
VEEVSDLITIEDVEVYETNGGFYLLTIGLREVNVFEFVEAQFDSTVDLYPREDLRPPGVSEEEVSQQNIAAMDESIDTALYVALERLGYDVGFVVEGAIVTGVVEASPADGLLEAGDVVLEVEGVAVADGEAFFDAVQEYSTGDTITLAGTRGGEPLSVEITLGAHPELEGSPFVGVAYESNVIALDLPVDITIEAGGIGGPSAGMMYTLTLMDLLTEEDLLKGHLIAGTGVICFDESVVPIGGVRQKVYGARSVGAEYVLVPQANYEDAISAAGDEIEVVPVDKLQDALDFLDSLEPVSANVASH